MTVNIFSTYKTGENRVTSSIIAVLRSLAFEHTERLLRELIGEDDFELVHFKNQVASKDNTVPDAEISSSRQILIETKIQRKAVNKNQILGHLKYLDQQKGNYKLQRLVILTPDDWGKDELKDLDDKIICKSFADLSEAITGLLRDETEVVSEREEFLLRELQQMFVKQGLVRSENDTVVVAARSAWMQYQALNAYVYQEWRSFQNVSHIAFYTSGEIKPIIPRILEKIPQVVFRRGMNKGNLDKLVEKALDLGTHEEGAVHNVFLLSSPDDRAETIQLGKAISNNVTDKNGRTTPFTQGHRYVRLTALMEAEATSDLV